MRFPLSPQAVLITAMMGGMAGYIAFAETGAMRPAAPREPTTRTDLYPDEKQVSDIFKATSPSVAFITTLQQQVDIFGQGAGQRPTGTGSGFVWDDQGHIVTNFHVIQDSSSARVSFSSGEEYDATLVGIAPEHDLAVLKIQAKRDLAPLIVGTSNDLLVGQRVYAIGNPFGLDHSLTSGIVSALNRTIYSPTRQPIEGVIQTDAAINPGNSGGPLLDSAGRLIGINTAINSPSGTSVGVGFAVPVDTINRVVPQLIQYGKVERATLGIAQRDDFTRFFDQRLGVEGVAVLAVYPGSAAEAAGLQPFTRVASGIRPGDVLQKIDNYPIRNADELYLTLQKFKPGDTVTLTYWREGKIETKRVVLDSSLNQTK